MERLRFARLLDQTLIAQRGQDARSGGLAQLYGAGDIGEAQLGPARYGERPEDSDAAFQALHLVRCYPPDRGRCAMTCGLRARGGTFPCR